MLKRLKFGVKMLYFVAKTLLMVYDEFVILWVNEHGAFKTENFSRG